MPDEAIDHMQNHVLSMLLNAPKQGQPPVFSRINLLCSIALIGLPTVNILCKGILGSQGISLNSKLILDKRNLLVHTQIASLL